MAKRSLASTAEVSRRRHALPAFVRLRRRRFWWRVVLAVLTLAVLVVLDRGGFLLAGRGDLGKYDGRAFLVQRVIDGDTLDIAAPDGDHLTTRIRVWGIDTPETAKPARGDEPATDAEPFADEANALATQLLAGQTVTLRLEPTRLRGRYERLLAHVELSDGGLLAERLLLAGLAKADARWPHQHAERFALLERQARRDGAGLWSVPADSVGVPESDVMFLPDSSP